MADLPSNPQNGGGSKTVTLLYGTKVCNYHDASGSTGVTNSGFLSKYQTTGTVVEQSISFMPEALAE